MFIQFEPEWTLIDSFYYCFITITTVGLGRFSWCFNREKFNLNPVFQGDYVPGQSSSISPAARVYYHIAIVLYMYVGLCMIMLWIALVLRIPYFNFKTFLVIEEPEISEEHLKQWNDGDEDSDDGYQNDLSNGQQHRNYGSTTPRKATGTDGNVNYEQFY